MCVTPVGVSCFTPAAYGRVGVAKDKTDIQLRVLFFYEDVFLSVFYFQEALDFDNDSVGQDEVRCVFGIALWYGVV